MSEVGSLFDALLATWLVDELLALDLKPDAALAVLLARLPIALDLAPPTGQTGRLPDPGSALRRRLLHIFCSFGSATEWMRCGV
jgi:hypothetical protein